MFLFQHTSGHSEYFSNIFETHTLHAYNPYYMLLWYLAQSFKKEKNTLLYTVKIFKKTSTHIFGLIIFSEKSTVFKEVKTTHFSIL